MSLCYFVGLYHELINFLLYSIFSHFKLLYRQETEGMMRGIQSKVDATLFLAQSILIWVRGCTLPCG